MLDELLEELHIAHVRNSLGLSRCPAASDAA